MDARMRQLMTVIALCDSCVAVAGRRVADEVERSAIHTTTAHRAVNYIVPNCVEMR